jgi:hypothetical protein
MTGIWLKPDESEIAAAAEEFSRRNLEVYRADPWRIEEDHNQEHEIGHAVYHNRQIFELVQNGADALVEADRNGRIEVVLTQSALYCANQGAPIDAEGVKAILHSYMSRKHGAQIGHFGVGFKSVLAVTDEPRFYSRSGSFGFDRKRAQQRVLEMVATAGDVAVLLQLGVQDSAAVRARPVRRARRTSSCRRGRD